MLPIAVIITACEREHVGEDDAGVEAPFLTSLNIGFDHNTTKK